LERFRVGLVVIDEFAEEMDFDAGRLAFLTPSQEDGGAEDELAKVSPKLFDNCPAKSTCPSP
jgi:hypothetical protein